MSEKARLSINEKLWIKQALSIKHGFDGKKDRCHFCGAPDLVICLQLHHLNGNPSDNGIKNLTLAHVSCNTRLR